MTNGDLRIQLSSKMQVVYTDSYFVSNQPVSPSQIFLPLYFSDQWVSQHQNVWHVTVFWQKYNYLSKLVRWESWVLYYIDHRISFWKKDLQEWERESDWLPQATTSLFLFTRFYKPPHNAKSDGSAFTKNINTQYIHFTQYCTVSIHGNFTVYSPTIIYTIFSRHAVQQQIETVVTS